jgi:Protein of unknown function (DUF3108)
MHTIRIGYPARLICTCHCVTVAGMADLKGKARRLTLALAAAFLAVVCQGAAPSPADEFRARYSVSLIGLPIGEVAAAGTLGSSNYRINLNAKLTGVAAVVSNLKLALASTGALGRHGLAPSTYATTSANTQGVRTVRMSLDGGNVKSVEIVPPFEDKPGRIPVGEAHKRNIVDPTSALIMPVPEGEPVVGPAACNRTIPVFDGYVRFNITLHYVGIRDISIAGYSGPVSVCAARYTPVAGHARDSKSTKFMAENKDIEAWLAPIPRAHVVVPLHVQLMTLAGKAEIDAEEFSVEPSGVATASPH